MVVLIVALQEVNVDNLFELNFPLLVSLAKQVSKTYSFDIATGMISNSFATKEAMNQIEASFPMNFDKENVEEKSLPKLNNIKNLMALMQ